MNQALAVMVNNEGLGFAQVEQPQTPKWQSILSAVTAAIPIGVGVYQATRQPQQPIQYAPPTLTPNQPRAAAAAEAASEEETKTPAAKEEPNSVGATIKFDPNKGLCIGNTCIPVLYLGLGGLMLFFLYKDPPRKGGR